MKSTKSTNRKTEAETGQLVLRAVVAQKHAEIARKRARRAKIQYKAARKAFKKAKKIAKEARKMAKAATKAFLPAKQAAVRKSQRKSSTLLQPKMETKKPKPIASFSVETKSATSTVASPPHPSVILPEPPQTGPTPDLAP